jgi:hypothetical protein
MYVYAFTNAKVGCGKTTVALTNLRVEERFCLRQGSIKCDFSESIPNV